MHMLCMLYAILHRLKGREEDKPCCESHYWAAQGDYSGSKTNCIVTVADLQNWVSPKEKKSKLQKPRTKKKLRRKRISKDTFPDIVLLNRSVDQKRGSSAFSVLTRPYCFLCCFPPFLFYSEYNIMHHRHTCSRMGLYF